VIVVEWARNAATIVKHAVKAYAAVLLTDVVVADLCLEPIATVAHPRRYRGVGDLIQDIALTV